MSQDAKKWTYPVPPQTDTVDEYHGQKIKDIYRTLEDSDEPNTRTWIEAENKLTDGFLKSIPQRTAIQQRLTKLWNYERFGLPVERNGKLFWTRNDGLQNQEVLYVADSPTAEPRVLLDPNTLREDGTVALSDWVPSDDGKLLAYGLAEAGSDWRTWYVRDVATGKDLADKLQWVKFSQAAWMPDGSGFFYSRYDAPAAGAELTGALEHQQLFFIAWVKIKPKTNWSIVAKMNLSGDFKHKSPTMVGSL